MSAPRDGWRHGLVVAGASVLVACGAAPPLVATSSEAPPSVECFGEPDDGCRDQCFPRDRRFECLARDVTGACVAECAERDQESGECFDGIECVEWDGERGRSRCTRRMHIGCQPE